MAERLDVVIFGATGFTGKYTVKTAARLAKLKSFTWGVAGRRKEALEAVLKEFAPGEENIRIITADLKDEESLKSMTEQARVIVNCAGPYRFYGEAVIKACLASKTHHVDVSGEPQYMEKIQLDYDKIAKDAGIYVISACGFDSIPCDMGIVFMQDKFGNGEVNSVETYLNTWSCSDARGCSLNYGTWESAVYGAAHANELRALRTKLFTDKLPELEPKLKTRGMVHQSMISEGWSTVFPGSDRSVSLRSQRFFYENYKQRPVQLQTYITFKTFFQFLMTTIVGGVFLALSKHSFGRSLLLNYPKLFSGGLVSKENPKPEVIENTYFSLIFIGKGWQEKTAEPTDKHQEAPDKEMITKITARNPGYGATCTALMVSAIMILRESDKMPGSGGVLPPGAAFARTSMIEELINNDFKFEVISTIEKQESSKLLGTDQSQSKPLSKL